MTEYVVLVDENGTEKGLMEKMEAHEKGVLHKAISVIIYNSEGKMLIQQRALVKYHWPGIWSNSCCSHPRDGESYQDAAERRLQEELGFSVPLTKAFDFIYKATDEDTGLTEHELDYVFTGTYDEDFSFNPDEVNDIAWVEVEELLEDIKENPGKYSYWFKIILKEMQKREMI